jgi:hypothetical protein
VPLTQLQVNCRVDYSCVSGSHCWAARRRTSEQSLPLLAMLAWPPHRSTHVLTFAWHQVERSSWGTVLAGTVQHGMGVLNELLLWAEAKPTSADAATTRVE